MKSSNVRSIFERTVPIVILTLYAMIALFPIVLIATQVSFVVSGSLMFGRDGMPKPLSTALPVKVGALMLTAPTV